MDQYSRVIARKIEQVGYTARVLSRDQTGTDGWGDPTESYTEDGLVTAFRTYPNRNTEVKNTRGEWARDRPILLFPLEEAPSHGDRVVYPSTANAEAALVRGDTHDEVEQATLYELQSPTTYPTHEEWAATQVQNE